MRVGGAAEFFAKVTTSAQLADVVQWANAERQPYLLLGGGSNILVSDSGVRGLVILNRCRAVKIDSNSSELSAESGAAMAGVARTSVRHNLTGLEWAVSVPGTIGGAIVNNAGAHGGEIKDNLRLAHIVTENGPQQLTAQALEYSYRRSAIKSKARPHKAGFGPVVLSGIFELAAGPTDDVNQRATDYLNHRRRTQPVEPSLGSMFMNPPDDYAGRLIEAAELKGTQIGQIEVSEQHANFIINRAAAAENRSSTGQPAAKAEDVLRMIELIQEKVAAQFGVVLKPEVQLVGEWEL